MVGPILFTAADGYRMGTRDVNVDLRARTMRSRGAVEGRMPLGRFSADQLQVNLPDRTRRAERPRALAYRPGRPQMSGVKRFLASRPAAAARGRARPLGQQGGSALKGHDSDAPVDVAADRIEVQDRADRAIFSGNVDVRQGNLPLNAARLTVAYANSGGIEIQRLEASGGVTLRSPSETARSQFAIYDLDRRLVTMIGGVTLTRGANRVQGGRLVLDLDSGRAVMDGGAAGAPAAQRRPGHRPLHRPRAQGRQLTESSRRKPGP